jgi:hypothetical protein
VAIIVPFPAQRRLSQIHKLAVSMTENKPAVARNLLESRLKRHIGYLIAKQVPPDVAAEDARRFRCAVEAEIWRLVLRGGRAS